MLAPIMRIARLLSLLVLSATLPAARAATLPEGVRRVDLLNYPDCHELFNATTRVVIGHHVGGRVLSYRLGDREALYLDPAEADWRNPDRKRPVVTAGRFDIGPEYLVPRRDILWSGPWRAQPIGPRAIRLTSRADSATGVQLIREFRLAADSSHLACRQIIRNVSDQTRYWCHWSRTFARHGGQVIIPLTRDTKFPRHYVMYEGRGLINARPADPMIATIGDFLVVKGVPRFPKLGMDSTAGWFACQMPHDLLFVKNYPTWPDAPYNEVAGLTLSVWYPPADKIPAVELEPIGPRNRIPPGGSAEFTEHWTLIENKYQPEYTEAELRALAGRIAGATSHAGPRPATAP